MVRAGVAGAKGAVVGVGAGLLSGLVVGLLARVAMRIVGAMSPSAVGVETDDGFEVGAVSIEGVLSLLVFAALPTAAFGGVLYVLIRKLLPGSPAARAALVAVVAGLFLGSTIVGDSTSIDFGTLRPAWFSVPAFVLLPALAGWLTVTLVERWYAKSGERMTGSGTKAPESLPATRSDSAASKVVLAGLALLAAFGLYGLAGDVISLATGQPNDLPLGDLSP